MCIVVLSMIARDGAGLDIHQQIIGKKEKKHVVHIHNGVLFSHKGKSEMTFLGKWMELKFILLFKINHKLCTLLCAVSPQVLVSD